MSSLHQDNVHEGQWQNMMGPNMVIDLEGEFSLSNDTDCANMVEESRCKRCLFLSFYQ